MRAGPAIVAALFAMILACVPAQAVETGTPAWTNTSLTLFAGPGTAYDALGTVAGEIRIRVDRCTRRWCQIHFDGGAGWVTQDRLSFGQRPGGPFSGPKLNYPGGGPGKVCFYTGQNYTGTVVCALPGTIVHDLVLYGFDNSFASIAIVGDASVTVCRDFNFTSYCRRVIDSSPTLEPYLSRNISSYRVH